MESQVVFEIVDIIIGAWIAVVILYALFEVTMSVFGPKR